MLFELQDGPNAAVGGLRVRAHNRNTFASTANLLLGWRVLLDGAAIIVGDPAQRDISGWYPGGSVAIAPQVSQCMRGARAHLVNIGALGMVWMSG